jgi:thiol-disulfide isomerase/thioredoxin
VRVIHHWATWCDPCVEELPLLAALHERLSGQADFLGVSWDLFEGGAPRTVAQAVAVFAREHGIVYPSLLVDAEPERFFEALSLEFRQIPQTWVVSASGEVIHRVEGILDEAAADELARIVTQHAG